MIITAKLAGKALEVGANSGVGRAIATALAGAACPTEITPLPQRSPYV